MWVGAGSPEMFQFHVISKCAHGSEFQYTYHLGMLYTYSCLAVTVVVARDTLISTFQVQSTQCSTSQHLI